MGRHRPLTIIAKERPFDEDRWKELLIAFAYVLHERRQMTAVPTPPDADTKAIAPPAGPTGPTGSAVTPPEQIGGAP